MIHSETPTAAKLGDAKRTNSRRKAASTPAPPRTRSRTTEDASSAPGNESHPMTSAILSEVMFSVFHSSIQPSSIDPGPIPSIPCSIAPPPPTFSTTPSSHRMDSAQPNPLPPTLAQDCTLTTFDPVSELNSWGLVLPLDGTLIINHQGAVHLRSNRPFRMLWQMSPLDDNALLSGHLEQLSP